MLIDGRKHRDRIFARHTNVDCVSDRFAEQFRCQNRIDLLLRAAISGKYDLGVMFK
jgi:hypothetical protein